MNVHDTDCRTAALEPFEEAVDSNTADNRSQRRSEFDRQGLLCLLAGFTFMIPSYGFMQSVGTIQSYLLLNQLNDYTTSDVGWIAGTYMFLSYFFNIQIGPICDKYGLMKIGLAGVVSTVACFFLLAECKTYWQFMLCLGVFGAIGGAILGTLGLCIVAQMFTQRRSLAMGIVLTGSSVGAIIFPTMLRFTFPALGWRWSLRLIGFVNLGLAGPGLCCLFPCRFPSRDDTGSGNQKKAVLDLSAFRSASFSFATLGQFLLEFAIFGVAGLLPTISVSVGFSPEEGYILPAIISVGGIFGRVLPGLLGDAIGPFNTLLITSSTTVVLMSALFIPFVNTSKEILFAFAALWGLGSASFLSITPVCIGKMCDDRDYGKFFGTHLFSVSFAVLLCVPVSGLMLDNVGARPLAGLFTGVVLLGGLFYVVSRSLVAGNWHSYKIKI